ncbi:Ferredoxin-fold anticodon-binding domain-containing protein 1-like [Hondaea fermentalgiana]|uniref:Ferredoxin-fold anticodon-binding domain-containing protein 1-like n=1 Tax=Hondaea fermentalgiana TaxID=2315210 RepID=A0A2R5GE96_9STRA|nr:Ferredoxin-fold anticodon-binding domain-containing protein 1-like [Hondaea fermentalgiana]|eukprot:GBG28875.1 Ferredoxin-fold anticodon-binding domain-containing protein 1-like [Hondaea fermentalgiana]
MDGEPLRPPCQRNVRPETCPRHRVDDIAEDDEPKRTGLYTAQQRILVVGDGDFTFSLALAKSLGGEAQLTCTSYQSRKEVMSIYAKGEQTLAALEAFEHTRVEHEVDAVALSETLSKEAVAGRYDRIVFNFPCVPDDVGQDGQSDQLEANRQLVSGFIKSAASLLKENTDAQIHIVHKTRPPFGWWGIEKLADSCENADFLRSVVFDRSVYPGYIPRKVGENKSFPVFDAVTYCFGTTSVKSDTGSSQESKVTEENAGEKEKGVENGAPETLLTPSEVNSSSLVKLTSKRLKQVVSILQLVASGKLKPPGAGKKRRGDFVQVPKRDGKKAKKRAAKRRAASKK